MTAPATDEDVARYTMGISQERAQYPQRIIDSLVARIRADVETIRLLVDETVRYLAGWNTEISKRAKALERIQADAETLRKVRELAQTWGNDLGPGEFCRKRCATELLALLDSRPALIPDTETLRKVRELAQEIKSSDGDEEQYAALNLADKLLALLDASPDLAAWDAASDEALVEFERKLDSRGADVEGNATQAEAKE